MANPVTDYEVLVDAAVAARTPANVRAIKDAFDPFVDNLLAHLTAHLVKHLDAAEAEEKLKPVVDRNQPALDWSVRLRAALIKAARDGKTPMTALHNMVSPTDA